MTWCEPRAWRHDVPVAEGRGDPAANVRRASPVEPALTLAAFVAVLTVIGVVVVQPLTAAQFDWQRVLNPALIGPVLLGCLALYAAAGFGLAQLRLDRRSWFNRTALGRSMFVVLAEAPLIGAVVVDAPNAVAAQPMQWCVRLVLWMALGVIGLLMIARATAGRRLPSAAVTVLPGVVVVALAVVAGWAGAAPAQQLMIALPGIIVATLVGLVSMPAMLLQGEVTDLGERADRADRLLRWADAPAPVLLAAVLKIGLVVLLIVVRPPSAVQQFDTGFGSLLRSFVIAGFVIGILLLDHRLGMTAGDLARAGSGGGAVIASALGVFGLAAAIVTFDGIVTPHPGGLLGLALLSAVAWWVRRRRLGARVTWAAVISAGLVGCVLAALVPGLGGADLTTISVPVVYWLLAVGLALGLVVFVVRIVRTRDIALVVLLAAVLGWIVLRLAPWPFEAEVPAWLNIELWIALAFGAVAALAARGRRWGLLDGREIVLAVVMNTLVIDVPMVGGWWLEPPVNAAFAVLTVVTPALVACGRLLWSLITGGPAPRTGRTLVGYAALAAFCLLLGGGAVTLMVQVLDLALEYLAIPISMLLIAAAPAGAPEFDSAATR